jgi:hypothetical protein
VHDSSARHCTAQAASIEYWQEHYTEHCLLLCCHYCLFTVAAWEKLHKANYEAQRNRGGDPNSVPAGMQHMYKLRVNGWKVYNILRSLVKGSRHKSPLLPQVKRQRRQRQRQGQQQQLRTGAPSTASATAANHKVASPARSPSRLVDKKSSAAHEAAVTVWLYFSYAGRR